MLNRGILVGVGMVTVIAVAALWAYLLIFGTPRQAEPILANFGITSTTERPELITSNPTAQVDTSKRLS
ncbi:MAG: hypothetical protein R3B69_02615 [Candidatus Paceibacterota bacterium]